MIDLRLNSKSEESIPILNNDSEKYKKVKNKIISYGTNNQGIPTVPKLKYPIGVVFILLSKFFEAFAANGYNFTVYGIYLIVLAILALFLRDSFCFTEGFSTIILHTFNFFSQFCPIFGAVLADNYFGNTNTVFSFFFIYALGYIGITLLMFGILIMPVKILLISSLFLISIGNGSIRACITSLGGSQFKLPEQSKHLEDYFAYYYFAYYGGILLGKIIPPTIRQASPSFECCPNRGLSQSYAYVFNMFSLVFLMAWVGKRFYKTETITKSNLFGKVLNCIQYAFFRKIKGSESTSNNNWIEGSIGRYSESFVRDVGIFIKMIKLFLPLSVYFALLAQQDSSWTFQVSQMDTHFFGVRIEPDQIKAIGPILLLLLIPLWEKLLLPALERRNIQVPSFSLITIGALCAVMSFICAGILQWCIQYSRAGQISAIYQLPQFIFLMLGEVFLSIPGLQYVYTEAPTYMKSLFTAFWFINNAIGNLIVVIITEMNVIHNHVWEFFLYAFLMLGSTLVFIGISRRCTNEAHYYETNIENVENVELNGSKLSLLNDDEV